MTVLAPCDARELKRMLEWTQGEHGPVAIRYAKAGNDLPEKKDTPFRPGKWEVLRKGKDLTILAAGTMVRQALQVAARLQKKGLEAAVVNCSSIRPLDRDLLRKNAAVPLFTLEEHMKTGGFGEYVAMCCLEMNQPAPAEILAVDDIFPLHGSHSLLMKDVGLDPETICDRILRKLERSRKA